MLHSRASSAASAEHGAQAEQPGTGQGEAGRLRESGIWIRAGPDQPAPHLCIGKSVAPVVVFYRPPVGTNLDHAERGMRARNVHSGRQPLRSGAGRAANEICSDAEVAEES